MSSCTHSTRRVESRAEHSNLSICNFYTYALLSRARDCRHLFSALDYLRSSTEMRHQRRAASMRICTDYRAACAERSTTPAHYVFCPVKTETVGYVRQRK